MVTKDRGDYAALTTTELLEAVKYDINPDWHELALALADRLSLAEREYRSYRCEKCGDY